MYSNPSNLPIPNAEIGKVSFVIRIMCYVDFDYEESYIRIMCYVDFDYEESYIQMLNYTSIKSA